MLAGRSSKMNRTRFAVLRLITVWADAIVSPNRVGEVLASAAITFTERLLDSASVLFAASATLDGERPLMQSGPLVCRGHSISQVFVTNQQALQPVGCKLIFSG